MANGDDFTVGRLTVHGSYFTGGHPLQVPDSFISPGSADFYRGYFGMTSLEGLQKGSLNVGQNLDGPFALYGAPGSNHFLNACILNVLGDSTYTGNLRVRGGEFRTTTASTNITSASVNIVGARTNITGVTNNISGATVNINSPNINIGGRNWLASTAVWDSKKSFDIPHPTKENHRLRYICVEGPEAEVYLRGKLVGNNIIELPDYWRELVDSESISVSLTPIGQYQELFVERIEWGTRIKIKNNSGNTTNCSYIVYGTRKDTSRNIPEYEGLSPNDYPGDNREYVINGGK